MHEFVKQSSTNQQHQDLNSIASIPDEISDWYSIHLNLLNAVKEFQIPNSIDSNSGTICL